VHSHIYRFDTDSLLHGNELLIDEAHSINIDWMNASFALDHHDHTALHWHNDEDWNEISYFSTSSIMINSIPPPLSNDNTSSTLNSRRLIEMEDYRSWNKYDHTTEHHVKYDRFIGESKYKRKYRDARAMCQEFYADLASIRNQVENDEVQQLCKKLGRGSCWIGLRMNAKTNSWKSTKKWLDLHPLGYTNWAPNEPNNVGNKERCTEIYANGKWNDVACNRRRYAICEKVTSHRVSEYIGVYKATSWFKGNLYCKMKYGTELASITSEWQQQYAEQACTSARDEFASKDCWIGLRKTQGILWEWTDRSLFTYRNWGLKMPQENYQKLCGYMVNRKTSRSGVWANGKCADKKWIVCNAKERTPGIRLRDALAPPSWRDIKQNEELLKHQEKMEIAMKKTEKALAEFMQRKQDDKGKVTQQDQEELRQASIPVQRNKEIPFGPPRLARYRQHFGTEAMDELHSVQQPQPQLSYRQHFGTEAMNELQLQRRPSFSPKRPKRRKRKEERNPPQATRRRKQLQRNKRRRKRKRKRQRKRAKSRHWRNCLPPNRPRRRRKKAVEEEETKRRRKRRRNWSSSSTANEVTMCRLECRDSR